jgi:hypothetical protein
MILLVLLGHKFNSTVWTMRYANRLGADETGISAVDLICKTERIVGKCSSSSASALDLEGVVFLCYTLLAWSETDGNSMTRTGYLPQEISREVFGHFCVIWWCLPARLSIARSFNVVQSNSVGEVLAFSPAERSTDSAWRDSSTATIQGSIIDVDLEATTD